MEMIRRRFDFSFWLTLIRDVTDLSRSLAILAFLTRDRVPVYGAFIQ